MANSREKSAAELISALISPEAAKAASEWARFSDVWKRAAGEREAAHSRVVDVRSGIVLVEVEHPGWIQLLQFKQAGILSSLARKFPDLRLKAIAFRLKSEGFGPPPPTRAVLEPTDTQQPTEEASTGADQVVRLDTLEDIKDEDLKSVLSSLLNAVRENDRKPRTS